MSPLARKGTGRWAYLQVQCQAPQSQNHQDQSRGMLVPAEDKASGAATSGRSSSSKCRSVPPSTCLGRRNSRQAVGQLFLASNAPADLGYIKMVFFQHKIIPWTLPCSCCSDKGDWQKESGKRAQSSKERLRKAKRGARWGGERNCVSARRCFSIPSLCIMVESSFPKPP